MYALNTKYHAVKGKLPQLKVNYRAKNLSNPITSSAESYQVLKRVWNKSLINIQEQVYILFLSGNNEPMCYLCLNSGTASESLVFIKLALACALNCLAAKIVISHNHPYGSLSPSPGDIAMTKRLKAAAQLIDVELVDHIIINDENYFSFIDNEVM